MKVKIVIKVQLCCDKCRSKALKIAAAADGVTSVTLEGDDKDKVAVVGDDVDAAVLTCSLRKKFYCAILISVEEVKPPKPDDKNKNGKPPPVCCPKPPPDCCPPPPPVCCCTPPCHPPSYCEMHKAVCDPYQPTTCNLM